MEEKKNFLQELLSSDAENEIVITMIKARNFDKAHSLIEEKLRKKPGDETAYLFLILLYSTKGSTRSAIKAASRMLKINPNSETAYHFLGIIYETINLDMSESYFNMALKIAPKNKRIISDYINFLVDMCDMDKAKKLIGGLKAEELSSDILLASARFEKNKHKRIGLLKELLKTYPNDKHIIMELARCYFYTYQYYDAYYLINNEIRKKPGDMILKEAHKALKYSRKWWYKPNAIFTSTATRLETPFAKIGLFLVQIFTMSIISYIFFTEEIASLIVAIYFFISLIYFRYIDSALEVSSGW